MDVLKSIDRERYGGDFTGRAFLHIRQKAQPSSLVSTSHSPSEVPRVPLGCALRMNFATLLPALIC